MIVVQSVSIVIGRGDINVNSGDADAAGSSEGDADVVSFNPACNQRAAGHIDLVLRSTSSLHATTTYRPTSPLTRPFYITLHYTSIRWPK